jgi:hypothetical protein
MILVGQRSQTGEVAGPEKWIGRELGEERQNGSGSALCLPLEEGFEFVDITVKAVTEEVAPLAPLLQDLQRIRVCEPAVERECMSLTKLREHLPKDNALHTRTGLPCQLVGLPDGGHASREEEDIVLGDVPVAPTRAEISILSSRREPVRVPNEGAGDTPTHGPLRHRCSRVREITTVALLQICIQLCRRGLTLGILDHR